MFRCDSFRDRVREAPVIHPHNGTEAALVRAHHRAGYLRAHMLLAAFAPLALHAGTAERAHSHALSHLQPRNIRPYRGYRAHDFMTGNTG